MRISGTAAVAAVAIWTWPGTAAMAQDDSNVTVDVAECLELDSEAERSACFAARVNAALGDEAQPEPESRRQRNADPAPAAPPARAAAPARPAEPSQAATAAAAEAGSEAPRQDRRAERDAERAARRAERRAAAAEASAEESDRGLPELTDEFVARITAVRERVPDQYVITLDNGQVWEQSAPKRYLLREGMDVRVYPSNWGTSSRMSAIEIGNFIQVRRVQ